MERYAWGLVVAVLYFGLTAWLRKRRYGSRQHVTVELLLEPVASRHRLEFEEAREAWDLFAHHVGIAATQLRPDDDLRRMAIMPTWLVPWDHGSWTRTAAAMELLRRRLQEVGQPLDLDPMRTLEDYVVCWCRSAVRRRFDGAEARASSPLAR